VAKWKKVEPWDDEVTLVYVEYLDENPWSWKSLWFWLFKYPIMWYRIIKWRVTK